MWYRSASFILDKQQLQQSDTVSVPEGRRLSPASAMAAENPKISLYYQTRAAHHGVVTSDWLEQAQAAAAGQRPDDVVLENDLSGSEEGRKGFNVVDEFNSWRKQPDLAEAVAAIRSLASVIRSSQATTMMELEIELKKAADLLKSWDTTSISLTAGCDLFMRYVTRTSALEYENFNSAKSRLMERAEKFGEISYKARRIIAMLGQDFILDGCTILVHGFSRVVLEILRTAAQNKKHFRVFCTEGRPDRTGLRLSNELAKLDVPVKLLIDSAVAYSMDEVDMVFVGADGVVESGGIINMMGTYQIALVAKSTNKPVYVAAESYKFARLYPLDQKDMVPALRPIDFGVPIPSKVEVETSAKYTSKFYHLQSKAPSWLTTFAPADALVMQEEAWNAYPKCRSVVKSPYFSKFFMSIDTIHKADNGYSENVHGLSEDQLAVRQVEFIDIASAATDYWSYVVGRNNVDFSNFQSARCGRGPLLEGWQDLCNPVMTAYKLVTVDAPYWGFGSRLEQALMAGERSLFLESHRNCFAWIDEWFGLTVEVLRELERQSDYALNMKLGRPCSAESWMTQEESPLEGEKSAA